MKQIIQYKKYWKILLLFVFTAYFPFTGSDCSSESTTIGGTPGEIYGTWTLTSITGYLQDICNGEVVTFDTSGVATLRCPNSNPITRNFTILNDVLSYTETGVQYNITTLTTSTLVLSGVNVGRTLSYTRNPADVYSNPIPGNVKQGSNSSEQLNKREGER